MRLRDDLRENLSDFINEQVEISYQKCFLSVSKTAAKDFAYCQVVHYLFYVLCFMFYFYFLFLRRLITAFATGKSFLGKTALR